MDHDRHIDAEGLLCPLPVLRARKALLEMRPGEVLAIDATDPVAVIDIPHFAREAGHEFLGAEEMEGVTRYRIRRA